MAHGIREMRSISDGGVGGTRLRRTADGNGGAGARGTRQGSANEGVGGTRR